MVVVFFTWQWSTYQAHNLPTDTFSDNKNVSVHEEKDKITFLAKRASNEYEIIFFQGGLTDPEAYALLCKKIAEQGYTCHLIKMDWRMPQWNYEKTSELFDFTQRDFILMGHSQGGKMAAQFAYENPGVLKGLVLLGTSHPRDIDLSNIALPTVKLYAENDGLASVEEVLENRSKLPVDTKLILIPGGNHSQFGYLGKLFTDNEASISLERQQEMILLYFLEFVDQMVFEDHIAK